MRHKTKTEMTDITVVDTNVVVSGVGTEDDVKVTETSFCIMESPSIATSFARTTRDVGTGRPEGP